MAYNVYTMVSESMEFLTLLASICIALFVAFYFKRKPKSKVATKLNEAYDYIVVGAGTAGCVLAARLSENPDVSVLLVEPGGEEKDNSLLHVPLACGALQKTEWDWDYQSTPQEKSCKFAVDRRSHWPRGKVLGGTGMLNFMMYARGSRHDYDEWAANGCEGWSYDDVLPYFLKSEDILIEELASSKYHRKGGPIAVSDIRPTGLGERLLEAGRELGYTIGDYNGEEQEGFHRNQSTIRDGKRSSTGREYLRPAMGRKNLHVAIQTQVTKIVLEGKRAVGIDIIRDLRKIRVMARKEVILSAGAVGTPQILMLSGIGPKGHLESLNIPVIEDLPVGENLQDHLMVLMPSDINTNDSITEKKSKSISTLLNYVLFKNGCLTSSGLEGNVFLNSKKDKGQKYCDIQIFMFCSLPTKDKLKIKSKEFKSWLPEEQTEGILMIPIILHPKSRGTIRLASSDPFDHPIIDPQYLTDRDDVETFIKAVRMVEKIFSTYAFKSMGVSLDRMKIEACSEYEFQTDEFWECYIRHMATTVYHPVGTCKMGAIDSPETVVDSNLKVKGISGLRVVDASIMPNLMSGNTNAPVVMIAEKAVDILTGVDSVKDIREQIKSSN